jgi:release factor H-coupled RctB family protein
VLLVHSGSRGLSEAVLRAHLERFAAGGLADGSDQHVAYLRHHDHAVARARANRVLIAQRVLRVLGEIVLDAAHNTVERGTLDGQPVWRHRKGATPADQGPVVIAGGASWPSCTVDRTPRPPDR